jgi:hypothetical protein
VESVLESISESLIFFLFWPAIVLSIFVSVSGVVQEKAKWLVWGSLASSSVGPLSCSYTKGENRSALPILSPVRSADAPLAQVAGNYFSVPVCRFLLGVVILHVVDSVQCGSAPLM